MFWADAVERSRTERLGRASAIKLRKKIARQTTAAEDNNATNIATMVIRRLRTAVEPPSAPVTPTEQEILTPTIHFHVSIGQPVDVKVHHSKWQNATVLDVNPILGVCVGLRLYQTSGPYTETRLGKTKNAQNARAYAARAFKASGESAPARYFGASQDHDRWININKDEQKNDDFFARLGSKADDLLKTMSVDVRNVVLGGLSRRDLRLERMSTGDTAGAVAMDRAMRAYESDVGPMNYYSNKTAKQYEEWKKLLTPGKPTPTLTPILTPTPIPALTATATTATTATVEEMEMTEANVSNYNDQPKFYPSLVYTGAVEGYSYELQHRGLGYYEKKDKDNNQDDHMLQNMNQDNNDDDKEAAQDRQRCHRSILNFQRELEVCIQLRTTAEEEREDADVPSLMERECDVRLQLAMLLRREINELWKQENRQRPPLEDEHQCGPSSPKAIAIIREALYILRGALLLQPHHPSARLNSVELIGMLPVAVRSELYGGSFTFDLVYSANPNVFPEFVEKRVPRTKFYDPEYRTLRSYGGHDILPSNAWLNIAVRLPGETKELLTRRVQCILRPFQRLYLRRYRTRARAATGLQQIYRGHRLRLAVVRKRERETKCCVRIFALWRGFKWRRTLYWMHVAATKISSLARGKHGRWMAHLRRMVRDHPNIPFLVVRIQQRARGYLSRWHRIEARRRLKSLRFLGRLGVWMLRVKKLRDKVILVQKCVRGVLARSGGVRRAILVRLTRRVVCMQAIHRGKHGRRRAIMLGKGIRRMQGVYRSMKGRWILGMALQERQLQHVQRNEEERIFVAQKIYAAVTQVKHILKQKGRLLLQVKSKELKRSGYNWYWKRQNVWWHETRTCRNAANRRAKLALIFSKFDYHENGRLGVRAFKSFIVDELCVPLTPLGFQQLLTLLDSRTAPATSRRDVVAVGGVLQDLDRLLEGTTYDERGPYVTFATFDKWWNARNGRLSVDELLQNMKNNMNRDDEEDEEEELDEEEIERRKQEERRRKERAKLVKKKKKEQKKKEKKEKKEAALLKKEKKKEDQRMKKEYAQQQKMLAKEIKKKNKDENADNINGLLDKKIEQTPEEAAATAAAAAKEAEFMKKVNARSKHLIKGGKIKEKEKEAEAEEKTMEESNVQKEEGEKEEEEEEEEEEEGDDEEDGETDEDVLTMEGGEKKTVLLRNKYVYREIRKPPKRRIEPARMTLFTNHDDIHLNRSTFELRSRKYMRKYLLCCCWHSSATNNKTMSMQSGGVYRGGGTSSEVMEKILASTVRRVFLTATKEFRFEKPPAAECPHCLTPFATVPDMYFHVIGGKKTDWLVEKDLRALVAVGGKRTRPRPKRDSRMRSRGVQNDASSQAKEEKKEQTVEMRWTLPCKQRMELDASYMLKAHSLVAND